jgi:ABC-type transporter Mla subunit MlaD
VFGRGRGGYPAGVSESGKRSLMQVEPTRLVELAASSEAVLSAMAQDWSTALDDLTGACAALGDAAGTRNVAASYADSLADAGEVVAALTQALALGVDGLVDAAHDAVSADDTAASELDRAAHRMGDGGFGRLPGHGGR